jgi:hypothetical protein
MISIQSLAKNTAIAALLFLLHFDLPFVKGQSIDERYDVYLNPFSPSNNSPDPQTYDYCLTQKADGKGYVAVSATLDSPSLSNNQWCIRLVEFDNNGVFQKSSTSQYIYPVPSQFHQLRPLKVITLNQGNGYVITGYHLQTSENCPMPFVVKLDVNYNVTAAHVFYTCGFFTDVDEMPNGSFMFSGTWSDNTDMVAIRQAAIMKTDANFNPIYARTIEKMPIGGATDDFDIVHDMVVIDDTLAYVTGSVTDVCSTFPNVTTRGFMLFGEVNLNNGTFNWTNNCINNAHFIGARIAYNNDYIAVAINAAENNASNIIFFNRAAGTFISRYIVEHPATLINQGSLNTHIPFIQSIYFEDNETVFFSGKEIGIQLNGNSANHFEIPFCGELDINGNATNGHLFVTDQHYFYPFDFNYYNKHFTICNASTTGYYPIWASGNTIPQNGGSGAFVTATHDNKNNTLNNKTWIFTNDNQVCGYVPLDFNIEPQNQTIPFEVTNQAKSPPQVLELATDCMEIDRDNFPCDQNPN